MRIMRNSICKSVYYAFLIVIVVLSAIAIGHRYKMISSPYQYPILPRSDEWKMFESRTEMVDACQIPETILKKMTTEALLETIIKYPFLSEMTMFYRTPEECEQESGFWKIAAEFNGLQEFMKREDALQSLKKYGSFTNLESNSHVFTIIYRNVWSYQQSLTS